MLTIFPLSMLLNEWNYCWHITNIFIAVFFMVLFVPSLISLDISDLGCDVCLQISCKIRPDITETEVTVLLVHDCQGDSQLSYCKDFSLPWINNTFFCCFICSIYPYIKLNQLTKFWNPFIVPIVCLFKHLFWLFSSPPFVNIIITSCIVRCNVIF